MKIPQVAYFLTLWCLRAIQVDSPPLLPPLRAAISVDAIIHNYRLSTLRNRMRYAWTKQSAIYINVHTHTHVC